MIFKKEPVRNWYIPYHCRCNALNGAHALTEGLAEYNGYYKLLNGNWDLDGDCVRFPGKQSGTYTRTFTLPEKWKGRRIYLVLDGTQGQCTGSVNGQAFDSFTGAAEFEITQFVTQGENSIELSTDGSIWGDVYLLARTHSHVWNYQVQTTQDTIEIDVEIRDAKASGVLSGELYNWERDKLGQTESLVKSGKSTLHFTLSNPKPWTTETPYLYTVLLAYGGEVVPVNVGFRKPILLERPGRGQAKVLSLAEELILHEKRRNANRIYVKPASIPPRFYRLCDYYGLEVAEASALPPLSAPKHPIEVTEVDAKTGKFTVTNLFDYTDLQEVDIRWTVSNQSGIREEGTLNSPCKPGESVEITLPYTLPELSYEEFFLDFDFIAKHSKPWRKAGDVICFHQFPLPVEQTEPESMPADQMPKINVTEKEGCLEICGEEFCYRFDSAKGQPAGLTYNGINLLDRHVCFALSGTALEESLQGMHILNIAPTHVEIMTSYELRNTSGEIVATCSVFWAFFGNGELSISISGRLEEAFDAPAVLAFNFPLTKAQRNLRYFGENHQNRVGVYQEDLTWGSTFHRNTRFICCSDEDGCGLFAKGLPFFNCDFSTEKGLQIHLIQWTQGTDFCHAFTLRPCFTESLDLIRDARVLPQI